MECRSVGDKDPRLSLGGQNMPLSPRNANTMWMLHFLSHLKEGGTAGFVMASGELSNGDTARLEVRKTLVEQDYVDCIVQLTNQLFANTPIPCSLWFLAKHRGGDGRFRKRSSEILFVDARTLGKLIQDSRRQKQLSEEDIAAICDVYHAFRIRSQASGSGLGQSAWRSRAGRHPHHVCASLWRRASLSIPSGRYRRSAP
ncbi:MAG: hypothetical protein DMF95_02870 [Acidobacteria bacterium]|nr:MAG: hypothetical protein DMF95_02870 [Acidobacteriota bacterium]